MKQLKNIVRQASLRRLCRDQNGVSVIEFALLLPILLVILVGTIEVSLLVLFYQKVDNATSRVADLITRIDQDVVQCSGTGSLGWMYDDALRRSLEPFTLEEGRTTLIVNSVTGRTTNINGNPDTTPVDQRVEWHWSRGNEGSKIGEAVGENVKNNQEWPDEFEALPNQGGMFNGDRIIAVEVFHEFRPLLNITSELIPSVQTKMIYSRAFYRARFGNMSALASGC